MNDVTFRVARRRLSAAVVLMALGAWTAPAHATEVGVERQYGVGLMLGDPTGLSGKAWVSRTNAIDAGLGAYAWAPPGGCVRGGPEPAVCAHGWDQSRRAGARDPPRVPN
jgi:hypothetical protein